MFEELDSGKYNVIYADPPWNGLGWNNGSGKRAPARHYSVQDAAWIEHLPVAALKSSEWSTLFLWATYPNLPAALAVMEAWGFRYATVAFTWAKLNKRGEGYFVGCGNYTRANAEICLLGTSGKCQTRRVSRSVRQLCVAPITRHSEKPAEIRERIVALLGDVPRIELFARQRVVGWDCWGNEVAPE